MTLDGLTKPTKKKSNKMAGGVSTGIRTEHIPNTSLGRYRPTDLLDKTNLKDVQWGSMRWIQLAQGKD
jgi:hypothetical protein